MYTGNDIYELIKELPVWIQRLIAKKKIKVVVGTADKINTTVDDDGFLITIPYFFKIENAGELEELIKHELGHVVMGHLEYALRNIRLKRDLELFNNCGDCSIHYGYADSKLIDNVFERSYPRMKVKRRNPETGEEEEVEVVARTVTFERMGIDPVPAIWLYEYLKARMEEKERRDGRKELGFGGFGQSGSEEDSNGSDGGNQQSSNDGKETENGSGEGDGDGERHGGCGFKELTESVKSGGNDKYVDYLIASEELTKELEDMEKEGIKVPKFPKSASKFGSGGNRENIKVPEQVDISDIEKKIYELLSRHEYRYGYTFRKEPRLLPAEDVVKKGYGSKLEKGSVVFAIDASGSISDNMLAKAIGVVKKFQQKGIVNDTVLVFDTKVVEIKGATPEKIVEEVRKLGGGTRYKPVIEKVLEMGKNNRLVMLTDGEPADEADASKMRERPVALIPEEGGKGEFPGSETWIVIRYKGRA